MCFTDKNIFSFATELHYGDKYWKYSDIYLGNEINLLSIVITVVHSAPVTELTSMH